MFSINPFKGIIKTNIAPHNRTLRTSFEWKLQDAFYVFFGVPCKAHFGIFDICTLGIPLIIHQAWGWCSRHKNPRIKYTLGFLVGLFNVPLFISRILVAAVCTYNPVSLMVTWAVHLISQYIAGGKTLKEEAFQLILTDKKNKQLNLRAELTDPEYDKEGLFPRYPSSPENLGIKVIFEKAQSIKLEVKQIFQSTDGEGSQEYLGNKFCYSPIFKDGKITTNSENLKALKALIKLNVGNVTYQLEKTPEGTALLKNIMAAPAA